MGKSQNNRLPEMLLATLFLAMWWPVTAEEGTGGSNTREGAATDIIVLGDSWGEGAGIKELAVACPQKTMVNRAVGGSTASAWAGSSLEGAGDTNGCKAAGAIGGKSDCSAASAFDASFGKGYTHAWLSVGGNDFLGQGCAAGTVEDIGKAVEDAIKKVVAAGPTGMKILMTGYGTPSVDVGEGCKAGAVAPLQAVIKAAAEASEHVTFVDVMDAFGGSASKHSDEKWYADNIHLNAAGYVRFFQIREVATFFGCADSEPTLTASFDCLCTGGKVFAADTKLPDHDLKTCATVLTGLYNDNAFCGGAKCTSCSALQSALGDLGEQANACCTAAPAPTTPAKPGADASSGTFSLSHSLWIWRASVLVSVMWSLR